MHFYKHVRLPLAHTFIRLVDWLKQIWYSTQYTLQTHFTVDARFDLTGQIRSACCVFCIFVAADYTTFMRLVLC